MGNVINMGFPNPNPCTLINKVHEIEVFLHSTDYSIHQFKTFTNADHLKVTAVRICRVYYMYECNEMQLLMDAGLLYLCLHNAK